MTRTKRTIEEKINYCLFFVGFMSLVLTLAICILAFQRAFARQVWQDVSLEAKQVAAAYPYINDLSDMADFTAVGSRITVLAPDGEVLYESATSQPMTNHLDRPEVTEALENGWGDDLRQSATLDYSTYYYALLLNDGNILRLARQTGSLYGIFDSAVPAAICSCLLILLLSVLLSVRLTRQIVRPLLNMVDRLDDGDLQAPYVELDPFVDALNTDRRLRESHAQMRQDFTANVSHELKTPLTSISGYAELICSGIARPGDVPGFAQRIHTEAQRMLHLVADIIQLTELDSMSSTHNDLTMTEVDLLDVAKACVDSLNLNAQKNFVSLEVSGPRTVVQGDRSMLEELCYNLCDNSIRYNKPGGRVNISTGCQEGVPYLRVADTGIGIPKESQDRVFERFYRVDKSRSKATGGTGLGLAIVKHIAQVHNARIRLESTPGNGTVITAYFGTPPRERP